MFRLLRLEGCVQVRDSVASIEHELEQAAPQPAFRPLEVWN